jgi:CheY-like chemotaxis protein
MSPEIGIELIRLIPTVLWIGLILVAVWLLRTQLRSRLSDLTGLKVGMSGVEATFLVQELEKAEIAAAANAPSPTSEAAQTAPPSEPLRQSRDERSLVIRRAERNEDVLRGARLLWVDDYPRNNEHLITILESLGVEVSIALDTDEALGMITRRRFDLIISDLGRGGDRTAGINLLRALQEEGRHPSFIFYAARVLDPVPPGAFGSAALPDQLLHLVLDALERVRG